jgi:hypothetical protein
VIEREPVEPVGFMVKVRNLRVSHEVAGHEPGLINSPLLLGELPRIQPRPRLDDVGQLVGCRFFTHGSHRGLVVGAAAGSDAVYLVGAEPSPVIMFGYDDDGCSEVTELFDVLEGSVGFGDVHDLIGESSGVEDAVGHRALDAGWFGIDGDHGRAPFPAFCTPALTQVVACWLYPHPHSVRHSDAPAAPFAPST